MKLPSLLHGTDYLKAEANELGQELIRFDGALVDRVQNMKSVPRSEIRRFPYGQHTYS